MSPHQKCTGLPNADWRPARRRRGGPRRLGGAAGCLAIAALVLGAAAPSAALAAVRIISDPLSYGGRPMPCPDPSVIESPRNPGVLYAACTSDYGQLNPRRTGGLGHVAAAFPIYSSSDDGYRWRFINYVFPPGHAPQDASQPLGHWPGPRYWAPELHYNRFSQEWTVYFTTAMRSGQMALFVAWSKSLSGGRWHSRLLHYKGQFNNVPGNGQEGMGGLIDPTVAEDPRTGQLLIAYCDQPNQIWLGSLSRDGLFMNKRVQRISYPTRPWEQGVEEGPVLYWDASTQTMDMFVNTASTWKGTYKVAFEASAEPLQGGWEKAPYPILRSGHGRFGPGMGSKPVPIDGRRYVFFHEQLWPSHASQARYLAIAPFHSGGPHAMFLPDGTSAQIPDPQPVYFYDGATRRYLPETGGPIAAPPASHPVFVRQPIPSIGNGTTQRHVFGAR